jgi:hypothetical protein
MNAVTTVWAASGDEAGNGTLYSVAFRAAPEATGQTELSLTSRGIGDAEENPVDFMLAGTFIDFDGIAGEAAPQDRSWPIWLGALLLVCIAGIYVTLKRKGKNYGNTRSW